MRSRRTGPCFRRVGMIVPEGLILMSDEYDFQAVQLAGNWGKMELGRHVVVAKGNYCILVVVDYTDCPFSLLQLISSCFVGYQSAE